jgi:ABC-type sugar transport system permease subunit
VSFSDWGRNPAQALALNPEIRMVGWQNYRDLFTGIIDALPPGPRQHLLLHDLLPRRLPRLGLGLAFLLDQDVKGEGFFRTLFLFPMSLSFVVTGTVWRWMLQPRGGLNVLPTTVGLPLRVPLAHRPHPNLALRLERPAEHDRPAGGRRPAGVAVRRGGPAGGRGPRSRSPRPRWSAAGR